MSGLLACSSRDTASDTTQSSTIPSSTAATPAVRATTLPAGTALQATIQEPVSSSDSRVGQHVRGILSLNVLNASGHIVIPGGASIVLTIVQLRPAKTTGDGAIVLGTTSVTVGDSSYALTGTVGAVAHSVKAGPAVQGDREVTATPGTPITITLTHPLTISAI